MLDATVEQVRLNNFRCFRDEQIARLAPLTLLVGENSTGKTSFLAMIRALWDVACVRTVPDFKESPYDLGSFDDIAHSRGRGGGQADDIEAGLVVRRQGRQHADEHPYRFDVTFARRGAHPVPVRWRLSRGEIWIEERLESDSSAPICVGTPNGEGCGSFP